MQPARATDRLIGLALEGKADVRVVLVLMQVAYFTGLLLFSVVVADNTSMPWSLLYAPALYGVMLILATRIRGLIAWLPVAGLALAYLALHDVPRHFDPLQRSAWIADIDRAIGGGTVPSATLQDRLYDPGLNAVNVITTFAYLQHFIAPALAIIILSRTNIRTFWSFAAAFLLVTLVGFFIYVLFPVAPPWMASEHGQVPPIDRTVLATLRDVLPDRLVSYVWEQGDTYPVGAFPSIHAAWPLLVTLVSLPFLPRRWRPVLLLYPLLVAFSLVYSGEHYATDVFAGWALAIAGYLVVQAVWGRHVVIQLEQDAPQPTAAEDASPGG